MCKCAFGHCRVAGKDICCYYCENRNNCNAPCDCLAEFESKDLEVKECKHYREDK